jgi:hypothetical protein
VLSGCTRHAHEVNIAQVQSHKTRLHTDNSRSGHGNRNRHDPMQDNQRRADDGGVFLSVVGDVTIRENQAANSDIFACKNATQLRGSLTIMVVPSEATILCMSNLMDVTGSVRIMTSDGVESIPPSFLARLQRIRKSLIIADCLHLTDVGCFSGLCSVQDLLIIGCHRLRRISGFSSLAEICGVFSINDCDGIVDLGGFLVLKELYALSLYNCPRLTRVTAFPRLSSEIAHFRFRAVNCPGLMSTSGITSETGYLFACIGRLHLAAMTDRFRAIRGASEASVAGRVARNAENAANAVLDTDIRPAHPSETVLMYF